MRVTFINLWPKAGMLHYSTQLANALSALPDVELTLILARGTNTHLISPKIALEFVDVVTGTDWREILTGSLKILRLHRFLRTVEATEPDVIHVNSSHIWLVPTLRILAKRYPVVATVHDVHPHPGQDNTLRKRLERRVAMKRAARIFVHGEKIKQQLLAAIPSRSPSDVHVTPHGEYSFFTKWVSNIEREDFTVLFFGRMRDYKGLRYLLDAAPKVVQVIPRVKFIIAGEGNLGRDGHRLRDESLYEVHNRYIPDEEVASFFQRASLVVLPYIEASQSGIIPIAYAFRLPVLATAVGCLSDVVQDGVTGMLVPPQDAEALADAIIEILQDKVRRVEMGENGYKKLNADLGWDNIAQQTLRVYEGLVETWK